MKVLCPTARLMSDQCSGAFALPYGQGVSQLGYSHFGDRDVQFCRSAFGYASFGKDYFADVFYFSGVFQSCVINGKRIYQFKRYVAGKQPRTELQQANRTKFADAVSYWQGLTENEKKSYNERARCKKYFGYQLFLREYMLSH